MSSSVMDGARLDVVAQGSLFEKVTVELSPDR